MNTASSGTSAQPRPRDRSRAMEWFRLSGFVLLFLFFYLLTVPAYLIDDSYISFRYAQHLADGDGLVYNIGGERVEGYSNSLWVFILAAFARLNVDLPTAARVLQLLAAVLCLPATMALAARLNPARELRALPLSAAPALLVVNLSFLIHAHFGLETVFFALLLTLAIWRFIVEEEAGKFPWSAVIFALAAATRPEGFIFPAAIVLRACFLVLVLKKSPRYSLVWLAVFCTLYAPYFLGRALYFGHPFPNSYYAKVGLSFSENVRKGLEYTYHFLTGYTAQPSNRGYVPYRWLFLAPALFTLIQWRDPKRLLLLFVTGAYVAFIITSVDDWMPYNRFFVHIMPLLVVLSIVGIEDLGRLILRQPWGTRGQQLLLGVGAFSIALGASLWVPQSPYELDIVRGIRYTAKHPDYLKKQWLRATGQLPFWGEDIGVWVRERYPEQQLLSCELAGAIPYYSRFDLVDTFGINDTHIARFWRQQDYEGARDHVLGLEPDVYTVMMTKNGEEILGGCYIDTLVRESESFKRRYEFDALHVLDMDVPGMRNVWLVFFVKRAVPLEDEVVDPYTVDDIVSFFEAGDNIFHHDSRMSPYS